MADGFETIGWVLKVENKATAAVDKIVSHLEKQIFDVAYEIGSVGKKFAEWGEKGGPIGKGVAGAARLISDSFGSVFGSLRTEAQDAMVKGFGAAAKGGIGAIASTLTSGLRGAEKGIIKFADAYVGAVVNGIEKAQSFWAFLSKREFTFGELFTKGADGTKKLGLGFVSLAKSVGGATKAIGGAGAASFAGAWKSVGSGLRSGAQNIGAFFQKLISIEKIGKFFKAAGGIVGIMLGPFGKLLDLFSPLLDMIVEQITPAIETFAAIVKTALGPFSMTLEIIAANLAHAIVPLIKPLASFLELAAVQIGVMIQGLLKGKPEAIFASVFDVFQAARPVVMHLLEVLLSAGRQIGGALMRALVSVGPALLKLAVGLLDAIIPLIEPLTTLAVTLLEKVFVPALLAIAGWLDRHMPTIKLLIEMLSEWIADIAKRVDDFFSNIGKYANDFKVLFIDPVMEYIQPVIDLIASVAGSVKDLFGSTTAAEEPEPAPEPAVSGGGGLAAAMAEAAEREKALAGLTGPARDEALREFLRKRKRMAGGGVALKPIVPMIGEEGPEAVLPLNRETLERTLVPILPDIKFPALDRLVELAQGIDRTLTQGTLRVLTMNTPERQKDDRSDIGLAPGMAGGGSW